MILKQCMLTNNITYAKQTPIKPVGIVVHSTGVNQTWLGRWVQPSLDNPDRQKIIEDIGLNNGMGWNSNSISTIVHAMIGKNLKGEIEVYQTLEWDRQCGGVYKGPNGSYNTSHIQFEMQEDDHKGQEYFEGVLETAIELCAYLCKEYDIPVSEICSHHEAYLRGYGSGHVDPDNWFQDMAGDWNMDKFRSEVAKKMNMPTIIYQRGDKVSVKPGVTTNYAGKSLAGWVIDGRPLYVYDSDETLTKITVDEKLSAVTATMKTSDLLPVSAEPDPGELSETPEEEVTDEGEIECVNNAEILVSKEALADIAANLADVAEKLKAVAEKLCSEFPED